MTLTEIMKDKERLYNQTPFRRKGRSFCVRWVERYGFEKTTSCKKYDSEDDEVYKYNFIPEDFLADDWEWVEEWYEGDLKKKYPNGVLCWTWNEDEDNACMNIITDYKFGRFLTFAKVPYLFAKPVKPEEAPAIIG